MNRRAWLKGIVPLVLIALVVIVFPKRYLLFPPKGVPVDTTHWKTYCIGRFLVDLPPTLKYIHKGIYGEIWGEPIIWRKDLTPETARQEAAAEIEKWKQTQNEETKTSMFIDTVELPNGGIAIVRWNGTFSTGMLAFQSWLVTPDPEPRVFSYTKECDSDKQAGCQEQIEYLASTLRTRNDRDPVPTEPGFCFDGGISVHTGEWRSERAGITFELPGYPGIGLYFDIWGMGIKSQLDLFEEKTKGILGRNRDLLVPDATLFRRGELTLGGGIPAKEIAFVKDAPPRGYEGKLYDFTLQSPSAGERFDRPQVHFAMNTWEHRHDGTKPFRSNEEALGLWEAITRSIRLRPGAI